MYHELEYRQCACDNESHTTQAMLQGGLILMKGLKGSGQSPEAHRHSENLQLKKARSAYGTKRVVIE